MHRRQQRQYAAGMSDSIFHGAGGRAEFGAEGSPPLVRICLRIVEQPSPNAIRVFVFLPVAFGVQGFIGVPAPASEAARALAEHGRALQPDEDFLAAMPRARSASFGLIIRPQLHRNSLGLEGCEHQCSAEARRGKRCWLRNRRR